MERVKESCNFKKVLDPRTKLLVLVLISVSVIASPDMSTEWVYVGIIILTLVGIGAYRQVLRSVLMYGGMLIIVYLCGLFPDNVVSAFMIMIVACFRKIAPPLFFASGMIATTKVGELVSAMQRLHIPKPIVITFAVTLRFFPTVKEEYISIKEAMRLRGIGVSAVNVMTRPFTVMESVLIPMMMRCATIAEELSAATVTRGIESNGKRTSITELKMHPFDWCVVATFLALTVFVFMGGATLWLQ